MHQHEQTSGKHDHAPANFGRAFLIGISLNSIYVLAQVIFGILSHSLALLADAGHNLGDVLGLMMAWTASILARRLPSIRRTYGLRRTSILASLGNAILLLVAVGGISWEAIRRIFEPAAVSGVTVIWVAATGIVVNGISAWLFASGQKQDLNIKGAFLHMMSDATVSVGVVGVGIAILLTHWWWLDPIVSLFINIVIVWGTWGLLKESINLALDAVPEAVDLLAIRGFLEKLPGIQSVHDLHVWALSTTDNALTAHLVKTGSEENSNILVEACDTLKTHFGIGHVTLQIETDLIAQRCELLSDRVI
ncbi:MAG: cation transporter [Verrucomicrobia bacterium]|nr:cation transporter [Verrucomicrobiota bacterium]